MSIAIDLRVLELLCSRLCHELISPVGAINNGVELMDEDDPDFVKEAMTLIGQSARKAGQRLQFYRFAYGVAGDAGRGSATDVGALASALLEGGKLRCDWSPELAAQSVLWQRLAGNLVVLAADTLPRGGTIAARALNPGIEVSAEGETINLSADLRAILAGEVAAEALTARTIHAFFTTRLAAQLGGSVSLAEQPGRAVFSVRGSG
jgi:histidine phosphotransferase ChpT